jgi:gluconolactonase
VPSRVAWHRPDAFRRVLSYLGSFTNLRGGDAYTSLIRKTEPKPIRVFLQSGKKDMNTYAGSWYIANQHLMASFEYMGYDAKLVLGKEGHNSVHGGSILPEALRWLWRDYPNRITTPRPPDSREWATNIVKPDKDWEVVTVPMKRPKALAADHDGNVFVGAAESRRIYKIARDGKVTQSMPNTEPIDAMAIGANGSFYTAQTSARRIVTYSTSGTKAVVTTKGNPTGLTVTRSAPSITRTQDASASGLLMRPVELAWFMKASRPQPESSYHLAALCSSLPMRQDDRPGPSKCGQMALSITENRSTVSKLPTTQRRVRRPL